MAIEVVAWRTPVDDTQDVLKQDLRFNMCHRSGFGGRHVRSVTKDKNVVAKTQGEYFGICRNLVEVVTDPRSVNPFVALVRWNRDE